MRNPFSIFLLAGFLLISAFANFGSSYAVSGDFSESLTNHQVSALLDDVTAKGGHDGGCRCESDTDAKKFTCGVVLALLDQSDVKQPTGPRSSRVVFFDTNTPKHFIDLLKKPPRFII